MNNKENLKKILDLLIEKTLESGGDGNTIWYSIHFTVNDTVEVLMSNRDTRWALSYGIDTLVGSNDQESFTFTTDKAHFNQCADSADFSLKY